MLIDLLFGIYVISLVTVIVSYYLAPEADEDGYVLGEWRL